MGARAPLGYGEVYNYLRQMTDFARKARKLNTFHYFLGGRLPTDVPLLCLACAMAGSGPGPCPFPPL